MPNVYDEAGKPIGEIPEGLDFVSMTEKAKLADKLQEELKAFEDKNVGVKSMREAIERKEAKIAELQKLIDQPKVEPLNDEKIRSMVQSETSKVLIDAELNRALANVSEEDRKEIRKYFDKLSAGETLNTETVHVVIKQAQRAAFPDKEFAFKAITTGRPPRTASEERKGFGDTEEGKEFAKRLGLRIEGKTKK